MRDTDAPGKVLVVDDEPHLLELLREVLSEEGYVVGGAPSGKDAIAAVKTASFQVAILDYSLQDMDGLTLAKTLKDINPDLNVILMTAHATLDMAVQAIQANVYDYLIKPIDSPHLLRSVENAVDNNRLTVENKRLVETLKKTNAELLRLSDLKSRFLSIVSHDLRSPLTSIRGYAQLLLLRELPEDQTHKFLKVIVAQSDHLGGLISDLMDVVSIQAGKLRVEKEPGSLLDIISTVETRMLPLAEAKKILFKTEIQGSDFPIIPLDKKRVDQALTNLIGNAFKHTPPEGRVTVTVSRHPDHFRVEVTDTGEGIPLESMPHIFEEFYQAEIHRSKKDGLGLGLTIAREIVHSHGGVIQASSAGTGTGATFWFTLPIPAAP